MVYILPTIYGDGLWHSAITHINTSQSLFNPLYMIVELHIISFNDVYLYMVLRQNLLLPYSGE